MSNHKIASNYQVKEMRSQTLNVFISPNELRSIADAIEKKPGVALPEALLYFSPNENDHNNQVNIRFIGTE